MSSAFSERLRGRSDSSKVVGQPAMRDVLFEQGMEPDASSQEGLREQLDDEIVEMGTGDTRIPHQGRMKRRMHSEVIGGVQ
jgi:hypothetical protein